VVLEVEVLILHQQESLADPKLGDLDRPVPSTSRSPGINDHDNEPDEGCLDDTMNAEPTLQQPQQDDPQANLGPIGEDPDTFECRIEELEAMQKLIKIVQEARLSDTHCKLDNDFVYKI
jgi:hypothetical protein